MALKDLFKANKFETALYTLEQGKGFKSLPKQERNKIEEALKHIGNGNIELDMFEALFATKHFDDTYFHPSSMFYGRVCFRELYFRKTATLKDDGYVSKFDTNAKLRRVVDLGTIMHLYIQWNLHKAGILIEHEVSLKDEEHNFVGHADGVVEDSSGKLAILEIKTASSFVFDKLKSPLDYHVGQASLYADILGYERIVFLYYNKNTSDLKVFEVDKDSDQVSHIKAVAKKILLTYRSNMRRSRTKDVTKHEKLFKRICKNQFVDKARGCPYSKICFELSDGDEANG